jgi:hippurate hydrolase
MPSEDVGVFGLPGNVIPRVYFGLGAADPAQLAAAHAAGKELPGPHTSKFEPVPEPTIATGVKSLTAVAMGLLQ